MIRRKPDNLDSKSWVQGLIQKYLSRKNVTDNSCPLASLATDIVVREPEVKKAYTTVFKGMNDLFANYTQAFSRVGNETILATSAMLIGGLAIARALDDAELAELLLESCQANAMRLLNEA